MIEKNKLCKDCVNFIIIDYNKKKVDCDFDCFLNIDVYKAMLYTPELFDCEEFEQLKQ